MDDLYSDDSDESPAPQKSGEESEGGDAEEGSDSTALLPRGFFRGKELEPGKRCEVEVVAEHEGEIEVRYVKHGDKKESDEPKSENAMTAMLED